ncbi:hypothetical protein GRF21_33270 [Pseudomonas aeruginosa]|uniref:hypothetical protein n=1 Tax=Pseudomonas aeruginosa TaxID=287 RepID=UPI001CA55C24|nr:hypothetical protein [Pseudomonas aeruginosa]
MSLVECDPCGNVDLDDLRLKAAEACDRLSCLMLQHTSASVSYDDQIGEIYDIIHRHGCLVYMD